MLIWLVNRKDVEDMPFNEGVVYIADASSLEMRPGDWPERLRTEDLGDGTEIHIVND